MIADGLVSLGNALGLGDAGLYGAVYFATFLIRYCCLFVCCGSAAMLFKCISQSSDYAYVRVPRVTFRISNIVTNNAAAALMFPIAINAATQTGADRMLMSYNLMLAASASFMSPFGYTTNLLVL